MHVRRPIEMDASTPSSNGRMLVGHLGGISKLRDEQNAFSGIEVHESRRSVLFRGSFSSPMRGGLLDLFPGLWLRLWKK